MLDVGCGEGFFLNYFKKKGLEVSGIDLNKEVIQNFFPHLVEHVYEGDLMECIKKLSQKKKQFGFINLTIVIEHVVDPSGALECIKEILSDDGILRISVPNDFSKLQLDAVSRGYARDQYWVSIPPHLNYFSISNFQKFPTKNGLRITHLLAGFPIEFFLYNPGSNYLKDRAMGTLAHRARIEIENMLAKRDIRELVAFRQGCYQAGFGRTVTAYCSLSMMAD